MKNVLTLQSSLTISTCLFLFQKWDLISERLVSWSGQVFQFGERKKRKSFVGISKKALQSGIDSLTHVTWIFPYQCEESFLWQYFEECFYRFEQDEISGFLFVSYLHWWSTSLYLFYLQETFHFPRTLTSYVKIHMSAYIETFKHIHLKNSPAYDKNVFWFFFSQGIC